MPNTISNHDKELIKIWVFNTVKSDPALYGGDTSNPEIMKSFANHFYGNERVRELTITAFSAFSYVSREKNKVLTAHPEFDNRVRFAPRAKRVYA